MMIRNAPDAARITFHGELRFFFRPIKGSVGGRAGDSAGDRACGPPATPVVVDYPVTRRTSIKDVIEALGPPHTEVDAIIVNGADADFTHLLRPGDIVDVHPVTPPMDVLTPAPLRPDPLPRIAFIVDANIGRLARSLRMLGFDTLFDTSWDDAEIAALARDEQRIVLTRDRALLRRSAIAHARLIRSQDAFGQLAETVRFFGLTPPYNAFSRCIACNGALIPVKKSEIIDRLLPLTKKYFDDFHRCHDCDKIYWHGSHHVHMQRLLERLERALPG